MNKKLIAVAGVIAVFVFVVVLGISSMTNNIGKPARVISHDEAVKELGKLYSNIAVSTEPTVKGLVDFEETDLKDALPEIDKTPLLVTGKATQNIEIFSSTEKATMPKNAGDKDDWLIKMAKEFNNSNITINNEPISVSIRGIASGLGMDYIISGKYTPQAFTPSNELWGQAIAAAGVKTELVEKRMAGNVAGLVVSNAKYDELVQKYKTVNVKTICDAVANGELNFGYTNPNTSSTGLNWLLSVLKENGGDNLFSDASVTVFTNFSKNIPFVSYTTGQMKQAAQSGTLDGFVFEAQPFQNAPDLQASYKFVPFGVRHDSPMYAIGDLTDTQKAILNKFVEFCKTSNAQKTATESGFNKYDEYKNADTTDYGANIKAAQKLWKDKKDGGKDVLMVIVSDISGSMEGDPLSRMKQSLSEGAKAISSNSFVGMVTFNDRPKIVLPIAKFDLTQRSYLAGVIENMSAGGGTAMYDAITVASKMLLDAQKDHPNSKLMIIVQSDGETNVGYKFNDLDDVINGIGIPVYTVGYNVTIDELQKLSGINEAANINADTEDVVYKLTSLFKAVG